MAPEHRTWALIGSIPSPRNSARSAVETVCCSQRRTAETAEDAEDAEDAEKAGSLNKTSTTHDEPWNNARSRQDTSMWVPIGSIPSPRNSARSAVETVCRSQRRTAERAGSLNNTPGLMMKPGTKPEDSQRWGLPFLHALCVLCGEHCRRFVASDRGDQMLVSVPRDPRCQYPSDTGQPTRVRRVRQRPRRTQGPRVS